MRSYGFAGLAFGLALAAGSPSLAASSQFGLSYQVERAPSARLSVATCLQTVKQASQALGYVPAMENNFPGKLAVFAAGPRNGGASLVAYCIAVDQKTAYVVQGIDYSRPNSPEAKRVADRVHGALKAAMGR